MPRNAAAPFGPASTQLHSSRAFRICWRSVFTNTSRSPLFVHPAREGVSKREVNFESFR